MGFADICGKKLIVIINGEPCVGKDTLVSWTRNLCLVTNKSSIDPIKDMIKPWGYNDDTKSDRDRKLLSDIKQLMIEYNDTPYRYCMNEIEKFRKRNVIEDEILFLHIREPEEIHKVVEYIKKFDGLSYCTLLVTASIEDDKEQKKEKSPADMISLSINGLSVKLHNTADDNVRFYAYDLYYENIKRRSKAASMYAWLLFAEESLLPLMKKYDLPFSDSYDVVEC